MLRSTPRHRAPGWHGAKSRVDVANRSLPVVTELVSSEPEWGDPNGPDRPLILVAHGGLIAALSAALLRLPVSNWPILGGMGNASWVQLSGHSQDEGADREGFDSIRWRLDVWNASAQVANDVL
jgi:broad specificity phosphatase PhoE